MDGIGVAQDCVPLERIPELKQDDLGSVIGITKEYLAAATGSKNSPEWEAYLASKRRFARDDLTLQIKDNIKKASSVAYRVGSTHLRPRTIPAGGRSSPRNGRGLRATSLSLQVRARRSERGAPRGTHLSPSEL
jgi:hypothetical protein